MKRRFIYILFILLALASCKSAKQISEKTKERIAATSDSTVAHLYTEKTKLDLTVNTKTEEAISKKDSSGTKKTVVDETFDPGTGKLTHRRTETEESAQRSEYNYSFNNLVELCCNYSTDIVDSLEIDFHRKLAIARDRESDYKSETGVPFPWVLLFWVIVFCGAAIWALLFIWKKGFRLW